MHELISKWDHTAWYYLNTQWHNAFLDTVIPPVRNQYFWIPLYAFLLFFMPSKFKVKGWIWCVGFLISFILSDQISATFIKPYVHRLRPCNNPHLAGIVHLLVPCGGGYSFPSSHATNHFSMGIFSAVTISKCTKWIWPVAIFWAGLISYAQVYVGVHYPVDVTCGALLGTAIGICTGTLFNHYFNLAGTARIKKD